jgi:hypothetical protein
MAKLEIEISDDQVKELSEIFKTRGGRIISTSLGPTRQEMGETLWRSEALLARQQLARLSELEQKLDPTTFKNAENFADELKYKYSLHRKTSGEVDLTSLADALLMFFNQSVPPLTLPDEVFFNRGSRKTSPHFVKGNYPKSLPLQLSTSIDLHGLNGKEPERIGLVAEKYGITTKRVRDFEKDTLFDMLRSRTISHLLRNPFTAREL